jgi:hypothetical protein
MSDKDNIKEILIKILNRYGMQDYMLGLGENQSENYKRYNRVLARMGMNVTDPNNKKKLIVDQNIVPRLVRQYMSENLKKLSNSIAEIEVIYYNYQQLIHSDFGSEGQVVKHADDTLHPAAPTNANYIKIRLFKLYKDFTEENIFLQSYQISNDFDSEKNLSDLSPDVQEVVITTIDGIATAINNELQKLASNEPVELASKKHLIGNRAMSWSSLNPFKRQSASRLRNTTLGGSKKRRKSHKKKRSRKQRSRKQRSRKQRKRSQKRRKSHRRRR